MGWKLDKFFSLPTMKRKRSVPINTRVELPVHNTKTWGVVHMVPRTYRMCASEHHCYLPLSGYVCTRTCQHFIQNGTSESSHSVVKLYKQNTMATFEDFTLQRNVSSLLSNEHA